MIGTVVNWEDRFIAQKTTVFLVLVDKEKRLIDPL